MRIGHLFSRMAKTALPGFVGAVVLFHPLPSPAAESSPETKAAAAVSIGEALQREAYGLSDERRQLLEAAAELAPDVPAAHWHRGLVRDSEGKWCKPEDLQVPAGAKQKFEQYARYRNTQPNTAAGHWAIAQWCAKKGMGLQQQAHLMRVLDFEPDHAEARSLLGFQRVGDHWHSRSEVEAQQQRAAIISKSLERWKPELEQIVKVLNGRSQPRRQVVLQKLAEIQDDAAIPAIEQVLGSAGEEQAKLAVTTIAGFQGKEASQSLMRLALFSPWDSVRGLAADKLKSRNLHDFVPDLLESLEAPLQTRFAAMTLPGGRVGYQHIVVREGKNDRDVLVLGTEYQRVPDPRQRTAAPSRTPRRDERNNSVGVLARAALEASENERRVRAENEAIKQVNARILWVLSRSTGKAFEDPVEWWNWWDKENDVIVDKHTEVVAQVKRAAVVDYRGIGDTAGYLQGALPQTTRTSYVPPMPRASCFAAGTIVWTLSGPQAIETIKVGDLVLSKSIETGELTYKPVLRTTVRQPSPLLTLDVGGETLVTTQGHLFWVSGEGWRKASELASGNYLHAASDPVLLKSVEQAPAEPTYNLVVADFNTYFVGNSKVLSHDVTVRQQTDVVVPGLQAD